MKTSTSSDRKGRWPLLLTEIFQKLKGVLNTQIFQIQGLSMHAREEKLERPRRFKLGGWGYTPPENLQFYVISMESLSLKCRRSSWWNVPSDEEQAETAVFAGLDNWKLPPTEANLYLIIKYTFFFHSRCQTKGKRTQMSYLVAVHLHDRCPSSISASEISKVTENWN